MIPHLTTDHDKDKNQADHCPGGFVPKELQVVSSEVEDGRNLKQHFVRDE